MTSDDRDPALLAVLLGLLGAVLGSVPGFVVSERLMVAVSDPQRQNTMILVLGTALGAFLGLAVALVLVTRFRRRGRG